MSYSLLVRPEAQADLAETQKWYEERATGLGRQFVEAVDDALASIIRNPLAYPVIRNVRAARSRGVFPTASSSWWKTKLSSFLQFFIRLVIQNCGRGGPNPRLQRTPLRAPLSRKPLDGQG